MENILSRFASVLSENEILTTSKNIDVVNKFEEDSNVKFPNSFFEYLMLFNAGENGIQVQLANFWPLTAIKPVSEYFDPNVELTYSVEEALKNGRLYSRQDALHQLIGLNKQFKLEGAEKFFIFGDYNINSCYWAIELSSNSYPKCSDSVICIYHWGNSYKKVADSFVEFLEIFLQDDAEALI